MSEWVGTPHGVGRPFILPDEAEEAVKQFMDALTSARGGTCDVEFWGMGYTFTIQPGEDDEVP